MASCGRYAALHSAQVFPFLHSNYDSSTKIKAFPLDLSAPWKYLGHHCFLMVACCCDRHGFSRIVKFEHLDIYPSQIVMLYHKTPGWISCQSNHLLFFSKGTSEKFRKKHIFWADDLFRRYLAVNNWFIRQRAFIEIWSTREVWRVRKMRKSCSRRSCSSNLSALQTSQVLHISMNAQLTYEPIVL